MDAANQFTIWLIKLDGRVAFLKDNIRKFDIGELEREHTTCKAEMSKLYDYAVQNSVAIYSFYNQLKGIEANLNDVKAAIEEMKRPWWQRGVKLVAVLVDWVLRLIGLGGLMPRLPFEEKLRLEPPKN